MHGQRLTALALGLAAWHSRYMPHDALLLFKKQRMARVALLKEKQK
jgi:hypothetical protein